MHDTPYSYILFSFAAMNLIFCLLDQVTELISKSFEGSGDVNNYRTMMNMESQSRGFCITKVFGRKSTKGNWLMIVTWVSFSIYLTSLSLPQICSTQSLAKLNRVYYQRKRRKKKKKNFSYFVGFVESSPSRSAHLDQAGSKGFGMLNELEAFLRPLVFQWEILFPGYQHQLSQPGDGQLCRSQELCPIHVQKHHQESCFVLFTFWVDVSQSSVKVGFKVCKVWVRRHFSLRTKFANIWYENNTNSPLSHRGHIVPGD